MVLNGLGTVTTLESERSVKITSLRISSIKLGLQRVSSAGIRVKRVSFVIFSMFAASYHNSTFLLPKNTHKKWAWAWGSITSPTRGSVVCYGFFEAFGFGKKML